MTRPAIYYAAFFGDSLLRRMITYAIVLYGAEALGGADWAGVLYFALVLPYLGSVHAGGIIDRWPRRAVLQASVGITALIAAALAGVVSAAAGAPLVSLLVLAYGAASAVTYPAYLAALPSIAAGHVTHAPVVMNILAMASYVAGPVAVGLLRSIAAWPAVFAAFVLVAVGSLALLWAARVPAHPAPHAARAAAVPDLAIYCRSHDTLRALLLATALFSGLVVGPVEVLLPLFTEGTLGLSPASAGLFIGAGGLGSVVGAVAALALVGRGGAGWWLCGSGVAGGVLLTMMTLAGGGGAAALFVTSTLLAGLFCSLTIAGTQACAPDELRGRIVGLYAVAMGAPPAIGGAAAGFVSELVGPAAALRLVGIAITLVFAAVLATSPALRSGQAAGVEAY